MKVFRNLLPHLLKLALLNLTKLGHREAGSIVKNFVKILFCKMFKR